jgi:hypothetical protein
MPSATASGRACQDADLEARARACTGKADLVTAKAEYPVIADLQIDISPCPSVAT